MRKETCMYMLHANEVLNETNIASHAPLLSKPSHPDCRIRLAWHDVLSSCLLMLLVPATRLENVVGHMTQITQSQANPNLHISYQHIPINKWNSDAGQILSVIRLQLHPWEKNKSQHVSTQSLHNRNDPLTHTDTAKKLKRLCRCLPGQICWTCGEYTQQSQQISHTFPRLQDLQSRICFKGLWNSDEFYGCWSNWVELGCHLTDGCNAKCCQGSDVDAIHCSRIKCTNRSILGVKQHESTITTNRAVQSFLVQSVGTNRLHQATVSTQIE